MKIYDFDEIIERRGTNCAKYDALEEVFGKSDLLPLWVADMDFRTPDFIIDALKKRCEHPIFGYTFPADEYVNSIVDWLRKLHGWNVRKEWITYIPGIVKGIAYVLDCFTNTGDKVIIQPPVYHPFRLVPEKMKREVVYNPLKRVNGICQMDFEQLESIIDSDCKVLILSNPHNPGGIVWEKETLQKLARICAENNILVISDEIHSEMVYPGFTHCPFPAVSDEAEACSITFSAPSKTFNIAGIIASYAIVPNDTLRELFYGFLESREYNHGTVFSYIATTAAYTEGAEWRRQMIDYVRENVRFTDEYLQKHLPQIKVYQPQASFLIWLDCTELGLSQHKLMNLIENQAGLAVNNGAMFGKEGTGFIRINAGCPKATLETALQALAKAVKGRS
ncbi:MAG: PatB family C-S lyase [Tannerella sp.]|jgi:cystathionine beta-lyase|nr:PatB family C-S lyase [Tannerella sp.]